MKNENSENSLFPENQEILLLNDSFPPQIDGVSNTVLNYARVIRESGGEVSVAVPEYPGADDSGYDYPVIRYPSLDLRHQIGFTAGNPFNLPTLLELKQRNIGLLHSHCPAASNLLARSLRETLDVPFITTYHTKFDIDIANLIKLKGVQQGVIRALVDSVSACDELWVVSDGAGKNIRSLGYQGDYIVMPNGVDMPKGRVSHDRIQEATRGYDLPDGVPVFLFVGRMMWYKGVRIILEALDGLKSQDLDFRMVFIGGGGDEIEIRQAAEQMRLLDRVIFTGAIRDRNLLAAWYCRADLLLFPSTFDTNGLVVREAAACSLASVLVRDSCAAEGVRDGEDGLLIAENAPSLAVCLARIMENPDAMRKIGENAAENLYYSWDDSVRHAMERYPVVMENYRAGVYRKHRRFTDELFVLTGDMVSFFAEAEERRKAFGERMERYL